MIVIYWEYISISMGSSSFVWNSTLKILSELYVEYTSKSITGQETHHSQSYCIKVHFPDCSKMLRHRSLLFVIQAQSKQMNWYYKDLQAWGQGQLENSFSCTVREFIVLLKVLCCHRGNNKGCCHSNDISCEEKTK
jgi:hypothetical protein